MSEPIDNFLNFGTNTQSSWMGYVSRNQYPQNTNSSFRGYMTPNCYAEPLKYNPYYTTPLPIITLAYGTKQIFSPPQFVEKEMYGIDSKKLPKIQQRAQSPEVSYYKRKKYEKKIINYKKVGYKYCPYPYVFDLFRGWYGITVTDLKFKAKRKLSMNSVYDVILNLPEKGKYTESHFRFNSLMMKDGVYEFKDSEFRTKLYGNRGIVCQDFIYRIFEKKFKIYTSEISCNIVVERIDG